MHLCKTVLKNRPNHLIVWGKNVSVITEKVVISALAVLPSAGKIDMVKSKWGLALAAVVTVLSSLLMSVGLCTLFGLTPTLNGG